MADFYNAFYTEEILIQARKQYIDCKNISLPQFLSQKSMHQLKLIKWKKTFHPLTASCHTAKAPKFMNSTAFARILSAIIGCKIQVADAKAFRFSKGDYTLLTDSTKKHDTPLFILNINVQAKDKQWEEEWGGYTSFLKGNEEVVRVIPQYNKLFIIDACSLRSFTKYVNHRAPFPVTFITGRITPQ